MKPIHLDWEQTREIDRRRHDGVIHQAGKSPADKRRDSIRATPSGKAASHHPDVLTPPGYETRT